MYVHIIYDHNIWDKYPKMALIQVSESLSGWWFGAARVAKGGIEASELHGAFDEPKSNKVLGPPSARCFVQMESVQNHCRRAWPRTLNVLITR